MFLLNPIVCEETYMSANTQFLHHLVIDVAYFSMYILELLSVAIIVVNTLIAFYKLFRHEPYARVYLLHGQSIGLTFKLGAEILRTVTATSIMDIVEVFLLIVIKACMVMLIDRELKSSHEEDMPGAEKDKPGKTPASKYRFSLFTEQTLIDPKAVQEEHERNAQQQSKNGSKQAEQS